jgi:polysaccharide deacetylase 2 family uncharacterized protein YibQ
MDTSPVASRVLDAAADLARKGGSTVLVAHVRAVARAGGQSPRCSS